jgi:hypothetical protein
LAVPGRLRGTHLRSATSTLASRGRGLATGSTTSKFARYFTSLT